MKSFILISAIISCLISLSQSLFCQTSKDSKFEQGKDSDAICIVFHGITEVNGSLFYFSSEVDEYALIGLSGSALESEDRWEDSVKIQIEVGGKQSSNRTIIEVVDSFRYGVEQIGIVIIVDEGKVDKLTWDDGCFDCSGDECIDGKNCATKLADGDNCGDGCDLKLYVSWYGTDKNGDYLLSAGQRLSQFQSDTAQDYYSEVQKEAEGLSGAASDF